MKITLEEIKQLHPGILLLKTIEEENMSQHDLAVRTGMTEKHISTIINGTKNISATFAKKLEYALPLDSKYWMDAQAVYDCALAEFQDDNEMTIEEIGILKNFKEVIEYYCQLKWMNENDADFEKVLILRRLMGVSKLTAIPNITYDAAYRMQIKRNLNNDPYVLYAWQRTCELLTNGQTVENELDLEQLIERIPDMKKQMFEDINTISGRLTEILSECGVVFKIVKNFVGAPVHGFIKRTENEKIIMCITLRGKKADGFWFTFFHEIGHIVNGDLDKRFVDVKAEGTIIEKAADEFAKRALLDDNAYKEFVLKRDFSFPAIEIFANSQDVKPFVVIGRLHKDEYIDWNVHDDKIDRYEWASA